MTYDRHRPGAFEIPSYELALWASRKGARAMAEAPASPAVAQRQESASAGAAHGRGGTMIVLDPRMHPALCGSVRCPICYGGCRWCGATLPPVEHDERDVAVVAALGRLCQWCAERQERVRD